MTRDPPVELDAHRGMEAQKSTDIRRQLQEVQDDQAATRRRQEEFETILLQGPATTWLEAAVKSRYLIGLLAASPEGLDPRRKKLIESVLEDLQRLCDQLEPPAAGR
jgi:hypothetical protein